MNKPQDPSLTDSETQIPQSQKNQLFSSPTSDYIRGHSLFLSAIDQANYRLNPEMTRIKNNILILLLVLASYGLYYLIGSFINVIIIGYISALAYVQARNRFTKFVKNPRTYKSYTQSAWGRVAKAFFMLLLGFLLPRLRYLLSNPHQFSRILDLSFVIKSFKKNTNLTVLCCQIFCCLCSLFFMLGPLLKKIGSKIRPRSTTCLQFTFAIITLMVTLSSVAIIPTVLFKQISETGFIIQTKVEQALGCQVITFGQHDNKSLPLCSDKVTENYFIKQVIQQFRNQNQTIQACKNYVNELQLDYIGQQVFDYNEIACTWYSMLAKAYNSSMIQSQSPQLSPSSIFSTGTNIFKHIFGNLTSLFTGLSNMFFYFTIWFTTFYLTLTLPNRYFTIKHIFSQNKQELIGDVTKLVHATCLIAIWHFICSILLLELFNFTPVNFIVAVLLSLMAFVPFFRPWFGVLVIGGIKFAVNRDYIVTAVFLFLYRYVSQWIYSFYYRKLQIHEVIISSSVLFGIYSFGVTGIFYGPLIVILFSCVEKQLLSNGLIPPQTELKQRQSSIEDIRDQKQITKKQSEELLQQQQQQSKEKENNNENTKVRVQWLKDETKDKKKVESQRKLKKQK